MFNDRQRSPVDPDLMNMDYIRHSLLKNVTDVSVQLGKPAVTVLFNSPRTSPPELALSYVSNPVFSDFTDEATVVGTIGALVPWERYFEDVLPPHVKGVDVVLSDSCGKVYTMQLQGPNVNAVEGDQHDSEFDDLKRSFTLGGVLGDEDAKFYVTNECIYTLDMYPTDEMKKVYISDRPMHHALAVAVIFIFTAFVFLAYDWTVQLRQNKVLKTATRTQAIVSSLFPKNVQERIFKDVEEEVKQEEQGKITGRFRGNRTKDQLRNFLTDGDGEKKQTFEKHASLKSKPIADLFPEATIIFADLVGFTAWSSTREPTQVFTLLEHIYHSFDEIAKRRRVFKVETVGDCYVAVSGLPEPRKDHAVAMGRFSRDILHKFREMVKSMVVELGPDTEDLGLRIGLHSGPVTAGVLRGERARFQLFGDTMNTTAVSGAFVLIAPSCHPFSLLSLSFETAYGKYWFSEQDSNVSRDC